MQRKRPAVSIIGGNPAAAEATPRTTAQALTSLIKSARDIMRKCLELYPPGGEAPTALLTPEARDA